MPTINQMKARMLSGHKLALQRILENGIYQRPTDTIAELRGLKRCYLTLLKWGTVDEKNNVTELGHQLLAEINQPKSP